MAEDRTAPGAEARVKVVFALPRSSDDWPPVDSERMWAAPVGADRARLDNIPFFVRGVALGDVVRVEPDADGTLWAKEAVECSGNCTIRIIPAGNGHQAEVRQGVLDAFAPLGVEGEGLGEFGMVALNVPAGADVPQVKRFVVRGKAEGRWHYEEGCVTPAWLAAE